MQCLLFTGCQLPPSNIITLTRQVVLMWHTHHMRQYAVCTQKMLSSRVVFVAPTVVISHGVTQYVVGVCKCQLDLLNVV